MGGSMRIWRVAELLDCSKGFVYGLIKKGDLAVVRLGARGLRVKKDSLQEYLSKNSPEPKEN
jgi:excisionase family DNA binding protein